MNCSWCGGDTQVIATRSVQKPGKGAEVNKVKKVVSWYTNDFIARKRKCKSCGRMDMTVELSLADVKDMMNESAMGHAPDNVVKQ